MQKLFVGNLSFEATKGQVVALFTQYGEVKIIRMRHKKGYAFVEMSSPAEAEAATKNLNNSLFQGRKLRICEEITARKAKTRTLEQYKLKTKKKSRSRQHDFSAMEDQKSRKNSDRRKDREKNQGKIGQHECRTKNRYYKKINKKNTSSAGNHYHDKNRKQFRPCDREKPDNRYRDDSGKKNRNRRNSESRQSTRGNSFQGSKDNHRQEERGKSRDSGNKYSRPRPGLNKKSSFKKKIKRTFTNRVTNKQKVIRLPDTQPGG